jgi:NAD(P)-dependent dehydrogenase (short-subunit alcohol dehydrogenase family)
MTRTVLVTGGGRGIGRAVGEQLRDRGYTVLLGVRGRQAGERVEAETGCATYDLDVADPASIDAVARRLADAEVDVLVNNAAVCLTDDALTIDEESLGLQMATNLYGPWLLCRALVPGMVARGYGRVVNVSSEAGSFASGSIASYGRTYGISKAALNALTVSLAAEVADHPDVKVNAVCPGWVRSDMGGPDADRSLAEGARGIVWAATLDADGPSGGFFRDGRRLAW